MPPSLHCSQALSSFSISVLICDLAPRESITPLFPPSAAQRLPRGQPNPLRSRGAIRHDSGHRWRRAKCTINLDIGEIVPEPWQPLGSLACARNRSRTSVAAHGAANRPILPLQQAMWKRASGYILDLIIFGIIPFVEYCWAREVSVSNRTVQRDHQHHGRR